MSATEFDLGVAGGGIVGLSIAWFAKQRGLSVLVVDEPRPHQAATPASAGVVWPLEALDDESMFWPWVNEALSRYQDFIDSLELTSQDDIRFTHPGLVRLDGSAANLRAGEALVALGEVPAWPQLSGAWAQAARRVCPARLQTLMRERLSARGVQFVEGALQQLPEGSHWSTTAGDFQCRRAAIACGAWKLDGLQAAADLMPVRGQMLELQLDTPWLGPMLQFDDAYMLPLPEGQVMIGSTVEEVGFDAATSEAGRSEILRAGQPILDILGPYHVTRHWAGLRPRIGDGLQAVIGQLAASPQTAVALGLYRLGVTTAPAVGEAFANWAAGQVELPLVG